MKLGLFTDTLEDINGVARFVRDIGEHARNAGCEFVIHTSTARPALINPPFRWKNFKPMVSSALPYYPQLSVALPPAWDMLHWAQEQNFDVIHCSTPGPVGICGWLIARWLKIPLAATYHTDFPAYVDRLSGSRIITGGTTAFMKMFYRPAKIVFARSREYHDILARLGVPRDRLRTIHPAINLQRFNVHYHDPTVWSRMNVSEPFRLLYVGRVSVEKNLHVLVEAFRRICSRRRDVALVIAGDGPYREPMRKLLSGLPAYILGVKSDGDLAAMYASADLFVFPSCTDTLGQVVMEAQACGLPALVSDQGGPKTIVVDGQTGSVVSGDDPDVWAAAIESSLANPARLKQMGQAAAERLGGFHFQTTFDNFWGEHQSMAANPPPAAISPEKTPLLTL